MSAVALIPARVRSKGIPDKNFTPLAGASPVQRAIECAILCDLPWFVSTDEVGVSGAAYGSGFVERPADLCGDDVPMIDVVHHFISVVPDGDPIVLLQPTQPLRTPHYVNLALNKLINGAFDSVMTVVDVPIQYHPMYQFKNSGAGLFLYKYGGFPAARQSLEPNVIRDGTAYVFWRRTVATFGNIYGSFVGLTMVPPDDTCFLDTPADWMDATRRLIQRGKDINE